jgi:hypothetical protein
MRGCREKCVQERLFRLQLRESELLIFLYLGVDKLIFPSDFQRRDENSCSTLISTVVKCKVYLRISATEVRTASVVPRNTGNDNPQNAAS